MHQKVNVLTLLIHFQQGQFWKKNSSSLTSLLSSLVFIFSYSQTISLNLCYSIISMSWALAFFSTRTSLLTSLTAKPVGLCQWIMQALKTYLWGTSNSMISLTFFSLGVNHNDPGTSSIANHKSYMTLGRLHDPWCKQPLTQSTLYKC